MTQPNVQVEAQLTKIKTMADRSVRIEFTTGEIASGDVAKFYDLLNQVGSMAFLVHAPSQDFNPPQNGIANGNS